MKTKTLALAFMLSLSGYAVVAQTDTIPSKDSIPTNDTLTTKTDTSTALKMNNVEKLVAVNYAVKDTVPSTDTTKTDTASALNIQRKLVSPNTVYFKNEEVAGILTRNESMAEIHKKSRV